MFWNNEYSDFVDLSIGRIYIKPITNGIRNKIFSKSTIVGTTLNNNLFFNLWEKYLVCLSNKKLNSLDINDGNKLRTKIKEILSRHGIITIEKESNKIEESNENIFSKADKMMFEQQMKTVKSKFGIK